MVAAGGDLTVVSGSDLTVKASHLVAGGDLGLRATGSVSILAGEDVHQAIFAKRSSGFGLFGGDGTLDIYHSKRTNAATTSVNNAPSTLVAGGNASVVAGQDVKLVGSAVMAGKQATLVAGRDLIIEPGQDRTVAGYSRTVSGVGIGAQASNGSASISAGAHSKSTFAAKDTTTPVASLVAGGTGVALRADRDVTITAADLVSGGHLSIKAGRDLSLLSQAQVEHTLTARRQSFAGLKLEVSQNVTSAIDTLKSAGHTFNSGYGGDGYRAIGAISGALKTVDAVYELTHPSVLASLTVGASSSRSRSERYEETARPTTIRAAGDVSLGAGRDLHLQGTQVDAGGWLALGAGRDVLIESARSRSAASQSASSRQAGVGVGATVGLSGPSVGPKVEGSVSQSRSQEQGETNTNAHLNAGQGISVGSGRDTTIAGARLTAPEIDLKVGRDLTVASRQDTNQGRSRSSSGGGSLTVGKDSPSSGSLSVGQGRGSSDRAWVGEQTGIVAGDRLSVTVGGYTWIHGAVLDSGTGNLSLDTGSLTVTDVNNHDRGRSFQATVGVSGSRNPDGSTPEAGPDGKPVGGTVSGSLALHDKQGLSRGTIGAGTITVRDPAHQSQDLAAINRDPKQAEVVTRDRKAGVDFYGSSSSLKEIGSRFAGTRQGLDQLGKAARDGFTNLPARVQAKVMDVAGKLDLTGRTLRGAVDAVIDALWPRARSPLSRRTRTRKKRYGRYWIRRSTRRSRLARSKVAAPLQPLWLA